MSDCIGPINIIPNNNQVNLQDVNRTITVIDNNCCTTVDVTQPITSVVQVLTGPMGKFPTVGPYGFTGSFDISGSLTVTGSIYGDTISSPYFTGSFYGNGTGIFSGSFSGSISSNLQDVTNNGNVTTLPITASSFYGNGLQIVGNATVTGSLTVSGSNTFRNIGPAQFTGSTDITGSLSINGIDYEFTSASFDTRILDNSSSIGILSSSYLNSSGSFSTRITDLENFSSSLDNTFATDTELNYSSSILSSSIAYLSSSYLISSASFDTRILNTSTSIALLSGSYLTDSSSFNTRISDLENFSSSLDNTFATDAELNAATASLSSSIALLSSSYEQFSVSYNTGSFNGSFSGSLYGTASWANNSVSTSYYQETDTIFVAKSASLATTGSNTFNGTQIINGDVTINGTASIDYLYVTYTTSSVIYSSGSNQLGDATDDVQLLIGKTIITGSFEVTGSANIPSITGSLLGTSSYANNSTSSSYALSASYSLSSSYAISSSYALSSSHTITSSFASTASYVNPLYQNVIITGSLLVTQSYISTIDYIDFNTTVTPAFLTGRVHWVDDTKTLQIDTDVTNFEIELGHQNVVRGRNTTGYTLTKGMIVYINGESGNRPTFTTASWQGDPSSASTLGFVAQDINDNQTGYVVTNGILRGLNTNAFAPGTQLYLSSSGQYTSTVPISPNHEVRLGKTITQATNGYIYVDIMNGYELGELHDVLIVSRSNGDLISWDSGSGVWKNTKILSGSYSLSGSLTTNDGVSVQSLTASFVSASNITGSLLGTASYANQALSSSYALTASFALNGGGSGTPSPTIGLFNYYNFI